VWPDWAKFGKPLSKTYLLKDSICLFQSKLL
jgi:hypothetical protein